MSDLLENEEWVIIDRVDIGSSSRYYMYHKPCWGNGVYGKGYVWFGDSDFIHSPKEQICATCNRPAPIKFQQVRQFFNKLERL